MKLPEASARLGSNAANKTVCAACTGALINGQTKGFRQYRVNMLFSTYMCRIIFVSTTPGWTAYTLTSVPENTIAR